MTPVLTWSDVEAAGEAPLDAFERTGCPPHASFWPAKLAHLRAREPELYARAARFAGFGDYLAQRWQRSQPIEIIGCVCFDS